METITRKSLLYKSGLGFYCVNHVQGCSHACRYPCYAFMIANSHGKIGSFTEWCMPKLVVNAEELLKKELTRMKTRPETISLCLSTDPFMTNQPEVAQMSLKLIELINSFGIKCSILTKGAYPTELGNVHKYPADNIYGISLISLNENFRERWESGTTSYRERIDSLRFLHSCRRKTLVHIEPYPTPNIIKQELRTILDEIGFVDYLIFSGWNYNKKVKEYQGYQQFYKEQISLARQFCNEKEINFNG